MELADDVAHRFSEYFRMADQPPNRRTEARLARTDLLK
jgi:hypothetical protein